MTVQEFTKEITINERDKRDDLLTIRESDIPLVLYGIGDYANTVFNFLKENQISVDFVCIDSGISSLKIWNDIPLIFIEELDKVINKEYNVIIGFSRFKVAEEKLTVCKLIKGKYFFDSISFFDFFDRKYILNNSEKFTETYNMLGDDKSKEIFIAFINGKLLGRPESLYNLVEGNQYFPKDLIELTSKESFVDAGAYTGDTLNTFLNNVDNQFEYYYAFEPDFTNFQTLEKFVATVNLENIKVFNAGVSFKKAKLRFKSDLVNTVKSTFSEDGELEIDVDSIDNVLDGQPVSFIKMDIEGAEFDALNGARVSIEKFKPKLAVSMYHKPDDLIKLPQLIKSMRSDYKFYLRHHLHITQELVLYAI